MDKDLTHYRKEIDALDKELVELIARRYEIVKNVAVYKHRNNIPAVIPERVNQVRENAKDYGKRYGLPPQYLHDLWTRIIDEACALEQEYFDSESTS